MPKISSSSYDRIYNKSSSRPYLPSILASDESSSTITTTSSTIEYIPSNRFASPSPTDMDLTPTGYEDPSSNSPTKPKRGKKVIPLSKQQLETNFKYSQPEAAKRLGVSLSTLKRRFYETHGGIRWPYSVYKKSSKKKTIEYIVNTKDKPTKQLDPYTLCVLKKAFIESINSSSSGL